MPAHHRTEQMGPVGADSASQRRRGQLSVLVDVAARAVTLQPQAEAAVTRCGDVGIVADSVATDLGTASRGYSVLYEQVRHLSVDEDLIEARDELCRVLSYHLHMLRDAGDLAFSGRRDPRTEPFRQELADGLGPYATRLLALADEYRALLLTVHRDEPADRFAPGAFELEDVELTGDQ